MNIKMIIRFKKAPLFIVLFLIPLTVFTTIAVITFNEKDYGISVLLFFADALLLFAAWCLFFAYGLRINDKRIIAVAQSQIKIIPLTEISRITVKFTPDSVSATIKTKYQSEIVFVWDSIYLGSNPILLNCISANVTARFVEKSISELSKCDKVRILNYFN